MPKIFISYRRDDSSGYVGRLHEELVSTFGNNSVFMDIEDIAPGSNFVDTLNKSLSSCNILIAVIGKQWLTITDSHGTRRIDDPKDFVRIEIATALKRKMLIFPVLIRNATMPSSDDLPDELKLLSEQEASELSDIRWKYDIERLIEALVAKDYFFKLKRFLYRRKITTFVIGLFIAIALVDFFVAKEAAPVADKFISLISKGNLTEARSLTNPDKNCNVKDLVNFAYKLGIKDSNRSLGNINIALNINPTKNFTYNVTTGKDEEVELNIRLEKQNNEWKIKCVEQKKSENEAGMLNDLNLAPLK